MWRIYSFSLNEIQPFVKTLQLHLKDKQVVTFRKSDNLDHIIGNDFSRKSMLIEFFSMNKTNDKAWTLLDKEFPKHFVWHQQDKIWTVREKKKKANVIYRVATVNPIDDKRYYLRLLLNHIRGATSFKHLKNVNGIQTSLLVRLLYYMDY